MNRSLYRNYIRKNFTWFPDISFSYKFPRFIIGKKNQVIDLQLLREDQLLRASSRYEEWFRRDIWNNNCMKFTIDFIQEFPCPIDSLELWKECCRRRNVPGIQQDRLYFIFDYLLPRTGRVVEIDGPQHEFQREYDQARDDYIFQRYGLKTLRMREYGTWRWLMNPSGPSLGDILRPELDVFPQKLQYPLDFTDYTLDQFESIYSKELWIVDRIMKERFLESEIRINSKRLYELCKGATFGMRKKDFNVISDILQSITGQTLKVTQSKPYK